MHLTKPWVLLLLSSLPTLSVSQTLAQRSFVMRAETTTFDPYSGMTHICILVYPDGRYRLERSMQGMGSSRPEDKVYLDTLPEASLSELQAILDEGRFQAIKTGAVRGGIVQDMDTLSVSVPREHELQNIDFLNAAGRKPFEKELKPFLHWMKMVQKRKVAVAKTEAANNCAAPQVMYRTTTPPEPEVKDSPH